MPAEPKPQPLQNPHLPTGLAPDEILAQLARTLESPGFITSPRLCRLLRFVVESALENEVERLKEFSVALEVFDRSDSYDPSVDSIVRVEARRLRSRLKAYYEGTGAQDSILIGLRPGSYVPVFRSADPPVPARPVIMRSQAESTNVTVAVLPFTNMSPEPEQDYFCDGITEEIINALTTIDGLNVIARTSAFQFKGKAVDVREIGERLGAQVIVEGSVRKAGDQLRITAQAINALNGHHLWSETYKRELKDIFAVQEDISASIAELLRLRLRPSVHATSEKPYPDLEAYTGLLQGMFLLCQQNAVSLYAAMDHFRRLTVTYPQYAPPYAGIAAAYGFLSLFGNVCGRDVLPDIRRNVEAAVRLDPNSQESWAVMAGMSAHWDFDWPLVKNATRRQLLFGPATPAHESGTE